MIESQSAKISIIFLLYNGLSDHFEETLTMVRKQKIDRTMEIIAIDSGSVDGTVDFVKDQKDITLYQIPQSAFGHGRTRQMGVDVAHGDLIIFLTQDATPANERWLDELIKKIESDANLMAVSSRIVPRDDAMPLRKYTVLAEWCAGENDFVISGSNTIEYKMHDISTIYRKSFLMRHGFEDVSFGEDVLIAKKILQEGYAYGFAAASVVKHSHAYDLRTAYTRNVIDGKFNRAYLGKKTIPTLTNLAGTVSKLMLRDARLLKKDQNISCSKKISNMLYSPMIHFAEALGQYRGNKL